MTRICETTNVAELNDIWKYFVNFICREVTAGLTFTSFILGVCVIFANPDLIIFGITICGISLVCILASLLEVGNPIYLTGLSCAICGGATLLLETIPDWKEVSIYISTMTIVFLCAMGLISISFKGRISRRRVEIILGAIVNDGKELYQRTVREG